jgi:hypothetical protein
VEDEEKVNIQLKGEVQAIDSKKSSQKSGAVDPKIGNLEQELRKLEDDEKHLLE